MLLGPVLCRRGLLRLCLVGALRAGVGQSAAQLRLQHGQLRFDLVQCFYLLIEGESNLRALLLEVIEMSLMNARCRTKIEGRKCETVFDRLLRATGAARWQNRAGCNTPAP